MKNLVGFLILILGLGSITAQSHNKRFAVTQNQLQNISSSDTLKILAIMVDFQEDKYNATIGTGKFGSHYSQVYGDTILDPLPHNDEYFADHLLFAKNYFKKVSGGKLNLNYKVLPEVITVSKTMREYVPGYKSVDLSPLGKFSEEVWKLADQKFSNVKFSDYDLFVIFHAGVSSGLDDGTFSIDRNMPSLYLSTSSLKNIFGTQFTGFTSKSGAITNTLIMPETESREQTYIDNSVGLIQVTINGELAANIGSHLGLPDLFDTETGKSAIGKFGLMDGQAIVANNGMFPPEPSPWEKMYLGWEQPKEISLAGGRANVSARESALATDSTLLKIPISSKEYFLVENRQQDAKKDDLILTVKKDTVNKVTMLKDTFIYKKTIQKDTSGLFNFQPTDIKGGVVIDVDEFDAALPGNGIVIWHIDENIINAKIADNRINSDLLNKGVDVEEADGIQDIGETFSSIFGSFIGEGTKEDFWFKGNKTKFYKNSFSPSSKPNTNSNLGGNSLITLDSFSELSNKMSFNFKYQTDNLSLLNRSTLEKGITPSSFVISKSPSGWGLDDYFLSVKVNSDLVTYKFDGSFISRVYNFSDYDLAVGHHTEINITTVIGVKDKALSSAYVGYIWQRIVSLPSTASTGAVLQTVGGNTANIFVGAVDGSVMSVDYRYLLGYPVTDPIKTQKIINEPIRQIVVNQNKIAVISATHFIDTDGNVISIPDSSRMLAVIQNSNGKLTSIILSERNTFYVIEDGKISNTFKVTASNKITGFSLVDFKSSGYSNILIADGKYIKAYSLNGVLEDNFPIKSPYDGEFISAPISADINYDGYVDIIATESNGNVYCFDGKTKSSIRFSTSFGGKTNLSPLLVNYDTKLVVSDTKNIAALIGIDSNKLLSVYSIASDSLKNSWSAKNVNFTNNNLLVSSIKFEPSTDFFPTTKAYNWPNPVYGSSTKIRYYVSENSIATVKIFDLSGALVTSLSGNAVGGMDNEIEWEIGKVQSGVYYANLEVVSASGKSANKIIKIAVIK